MNQCNDPDHGAINAERAESRGLRKAWVELDDKRQSIERELTAVTDERDGLRSAIKYAGYQLNKVTKQRDRLAEALLELRNNESLSLGGAAYKIVEQALQYEMVEQSLQSLTTNEL